MSTFGRTPGRRGRHRRRSRRLSRRDPARSARQEGHLHRSRRGRRRLPQLGLHPDQSAAARRRSRSVRSTRRRRSASRCPKPKSIARRVAKFKTDVVNANVNGVKTLFKANNVEFLRTAKRRSSPEQRSQSKTRGRQRRGSRRRTIVIATGSRAGRRQGVAARRRDDHQLRRRRPARSAFRRRLLVIGGGVIGLEFATVYSALGAQGLGRRDDAADSHRHRSRDRQDARAHPEKAGRRDHARHEGRGDREDGKTACSATLNGEATERQRRNARVRHGARRRRAPAGHR